MQGVREYIEGLDVELLEALPADAARDYDRCAQHRTTVRALNEGGQNCVEIDLLDLLAWVKAERPELLDACDR